jgi:hypothetical protein
MLRELGLGLEYVTATVEAASRASPVHLHGLMAMRALHHVGERYILVRAMRTHTGLGAFPLR